MPLFEDAALREEHGKALRCYERALFYASETFPSPRIEDQAKPYKLITTLYVCAAAMSHQRLISVARIYFPLRRRIDKLAEQPADRGLVALIYSQKELFRNFNAVLDAVEKNDRLNLPLSQIADKYKQNWFGLNNMCHLLMEEITYLSGRVDTLNDYFNTAQSLKHAVWGIGISAGLSFCGIIVSILLNDAGKAAAPNRSNTALYLELGKAREKMSELATRDSQGNSAGSADMEEKLDALTHDLTLATGGQMNQVHAERSPAPP